MAYPRPLRVSRGWSLLLAAVLVLAGCAGSQQASETTREITLEAAASQTRITDVLAEDPQVEALVAPYRETMQATMGEPLAVCPRPMKTDHPEGLLGALIADFVLERARAESRERVDACVINNGGLRIPWPKGVITLRLVYEVMPFDNEIVLLRLDADQMRALAAEIGARRGEPISGFGFAISGSEVVDVQVGGEPVAARDYWVATSDYLAGGGGGMSTLWEPREIRRTRVLVRDAIADALRGHGQVGGGELGEIPLPAMGRIRER